MERMYHISFALAYEITVLHKAQLQNAQWGEGQGKGGAHLSRVSIASAIWVRSSSGACRPLNTYLRYRETYTEAFLA